MTDQRSPSNDHKTTSTGSALSESSYLDAHFEAMKPEYRTMIRSVGIQPGWRVLDGGCGSGSFLSLLAELVGEGGHISALDLAPENIEAVETLVDSGRIGCSVATKVGGVTSLPYEDNSFDAVWCAAVTQYLTDRELREALDEFRHVVRPGGIVAVKDFDKTLQHLIPGNHAVQWALITALLSNNTHFRGMLRVPDLHMWFKQAGLIDIRYKTTICERQAPLRPAEHTFIGAIFEYNARIAENIGLPETVLLTWRKLANPDSPDHIINSPNYYYREGHLIIVGRVPDA